MLCRLVVFVLVAIINVGAQLPFVGSCPKTINVVPDFSASKYFGKWYENRKYFAIFELGGKCITADYSQGENGTVKVVNGQINVLTNKPSSIEGYAVPDPKETAKLTVTFPSLPVQVSAPYWVLGTDYTNYSVVYSCLDLGFVNAKTIWILTRKRVPEEAIVEKAKKVLNDQGLDANLLITTDQTYC